MFIYTEFFTYFFLIFCVLYNVFLFFSFLGLSILTSSLKASASPNTSANYNPLPIITVMIPILNEEKVIEKSIKHLLDLPYAGRLELLAIDDHSTDDTPLILTKLSEDHPRCLLLRRDKTRSRLGKGDVLNHGFSYLRHQKFPERDTPLLPSKGVNGTQNRRKEGQLRSSFLLPLFVFPFVGGRFFCPHANGMKKEAVSWACPSRGLFNRRRGTGPPSAVLEQCPSIDVMTKFGWSEEGGSIALLYRLVRSRDGLRFQT